MKRNLAFVLSCVLVLGLFMSGCSEKDVEETSNAPASFSQEDTGKTQADEENPQGSQSEKQDFSSDTADGDADKEAVEATTEKDISGQSEITMLSEFTAQTLDGKTVDESIYKNAKLTVVNVWGTFCSPCINEMPHLGELAKEYDGKGVQILGIVSDAYDGDLKVSASVVADAKEIVSSTKASYTHIIPDLELYRQLLSNIAAFPTTFFVDSEGNYVGKAVVGALDKDGWTKQIDEKLALLG